MNAPNEPKRSRSSGNRIVSCILESMCKPLTSRIVASSTCHLEAQSCADTVPAELAGHKCKPRHAANRGAPSK